MNLRNHKTYIDELLERVQVDLLSPDEASTLLWAILDTFNRAYQVAMDDHERRPTEQYLKRRAPDLIFGVGRDDAPPVVFSADNITPPLFTQSIPAADARLIELDRGPMPDHKIITVVRRNRKMNAPDYLKGVRDVMRALDQDQIPFVKAENDERTAMYFYHATAPVGDHFKPDYTCCLVCGEPITWSIGDQKWRHFAHPPTQLHEAVAEGDLNQPTDISVPEVGDCQRYPTASVSGDNTLYCYKCKGAAIFQSVGPGISRWIHTNPAQQKDHKVNLTGRSDLDDRTCIKCGQAIFYGAHPGGGVGWVHYGPTEPSHVAVEEIRTGPDPEAELVDIDSIPEDWDTEEELTDGPWNDAVPAKPEITIHADQVSPGAYTLWNSLTEDNAAAIHKSHRDGGLPERA